MKKPLSFAFVLSTLGLAFVLAAPAEAAKAGKHRKPGVTVHAAGRHHGGPGQRDAFQGGVPAGPLYNGQDYLGDDPDPNIRSQIIRDLGSRYGGGR